MEVRVLPGQPPKPVCMYHTGRFFAFTPSVLSFCPPNAYRTPCTDYRKLPFLTERTWQTYDRPEVLEAEPVDVPLGPRQASSEKDMEVFLKQILGGEERIFRTPWSYVHVHAESLGRHLYASDPGRIHYLPALPAILESPQEIWAQFIQDARGKALLRLYYVRVLKLGKDRAMVFIGESSRGMVKNATIIPMRYARKRDIRALNRRVRQGLLLYYKK